MKILVIAAHPDDEVIGMGGTIAKHSSQGDEVYLLVISEGVSAQYKNKKKFLKIRREACLSSAEILGINKVFFENFPDAKLSSIPQLEINKVIEGHIKKINPDRIYTHHWGDIHKDHQAVYESTLVAARNFSSEILCYEVISSSSKLKNPKKHFIPNYYVNMSGFLETKINALSKYISEIKEFPHPLSKKALISLAKIRGVESNLKSAEAFVLVKKTEK
jgi:N-acetylglucosamine malate deacetylase 1